MCSDVAILPDSSPTPAGRTHVTAGTCNRRNEASLQSSAPFSYDIVGFANVRSLRLSHHLREPALLLNALAQMPEGVFARGSFPENACEKPDFATRRWCPGQDSNLHTLRQRLLRPSCLPFHHPGEGCSYSDFRAPSDAVQARSPFGNARSGAGRLTTRQRRQKLRCAARTGPRLKVRRQRQQGCVAPRPARERHSDRQPTHMRRRDGNARVTGDCRQP